MAKDPTQKAKMVLKALELTFTRDVANDYYLQPKLQKCLAVKELAREIAALSTRNEDPEEIERIANMLMRRIIWFLSAGYSISTPLGYFRPVAQGVLMESELMQAPPRDRLRLGVSYTMSKEMRQALAESEIDVEIQKSATGPQIYAVVSTHDAQQPEAVTRGEGVAVQAGQTCIIKGRNIKIGGTAEGIGVTIARTDGGSGQTHFFAPARLYPNTLTQVGFVMPSDAPEGSTWSVSLSTQLGNNGQVVKTIRTTVMPHYFVIGEVGDNPNPGDTGQGGNDPGWVDPTA